MSFFSVKQAPKVYLKTNLKPDARMTISIELLEKICYSTLVLCFSAYESLLFCLAFSLCFFGALRISELLPCSKIDMSGIYFSDLLLNDGFVQIPIRRSKTDQLGQGSWGTLRQYSASPVCPFYFIKRFLESLPSLCGSSLDS